MEDGKVGVQVIAFRREMDTPHPVQEHLIGAVELGSDDQRPGQ